MAYHKTPTKQDEGGTAVVKSLYVCQAEGCGWYFENAKPRQFCNDHLTAESRKEVEAEFNKLHAPHP